MSTPTPGPWTCDVVVDDIRARPDHAIQPTYAINVVGHAWPIVDPTTARANARLIAAAPAMLEALHIAAEALDNYSDVNDGADGQPVANRAMSALRDIEAAIAKAEGAQ